MFRQGYFGDHFVGKPDWEIALLKQTFVQQKQTIYPQSADLHPKLNQKAAAKLVQTNSKDIKNYGILVI